jgi:large subunit ribosomal protein L21
MFAIFTAAGSQHKASEGDVLKLNKLEGKIGDITSFLSVLAVGDDKSTKVGAPTVEGAKVEAEILEQKKDKKIIIFKKKRRQNYRRKNGHRQEVTVVRIKKIVM